MNLRHKAKMGKPSTEARLKSATVWDDEHAFQAVLLDKETVLLTTYMQKYNEWLQAGAQHHAPEGTMLGYWTAYRRQKWKATIMYTTAAKVHQCVQELQTTKWARTEQTVQDPPNILMQKISAWSHTSFLQTKTGQVIRCIAPPVWVWATMDRLAGAWCIVATSYTEEMVMLTNPNDTTAVGLVPVSTLANTPSLKQHM